MGRRGAVDRRDEEVEVGRPGLAVAGDAGGEDQLLAVGGEGVFVAVAEWFAGDIGVEGVGDVDGVAAAVEGPDEEVAAAAVLPGVPVADEQAGVELAGAGGLALLEACGGAGEDLLRLAVGEDLGGEGEVLAVGADGIAGDVERELGDDGRRGAVDRGAPDLLLAVLLGEEQQVMTVGQPARAALAVRVRGELDRGLAVEADHPQVAAAAVVREVGLAQGVDDAAAVRADLRVADAVEGEQVAGRERVHGLGGDLLLAEGPGGLDLGARAGGPRRGRAALDVRAAAVAGEGQEGDAAEVQGREGSTHLPPGYLRGRRGGNFQAVWG
jgi:hypothetical protein